ncbi:hypothetical protein ISF_07015 [Cordyceps fumosorosea ARSEF 2679]|uniref:Uncharacterized protein n=1 Tax=Cordyceps fumosorosea (strain ARSEF 2679) TaxID=1081104 RepID=A0A167QMG6_CORFA|nr:hypothetical protein ISF_07015 [Cordyceps fumosorosea ARSEF 2679]OAA57774.1 hypothetical protein ISF_07015 [Cordyceps fumosorosea ARSEF 2679]
MRMVPSCQKRAGSNTVNSREQKDGHQNQFSIDMYNFEQNALNTSIKNEYAQPRRPLESKPISIPGSMPQPQNAVKPESNEENYVSGCGTKSIPIPKRKKKGTDQQR